VIDQNMSFGFRYRLVYLRFGCLFFFCCRIWCLINRFFGTTTINAIQPEVIKKSEARQAIDDIARAKKEAIDQTPDATTEGIDCSCTICFCFIHT
jgi:hypothetical protein